MCDVGGVIGMLNRQCVVWEVLVMRVRGEFCVCCGRRIVHGVDSACFRRCMVCD